MSKNIFFTLVLSLFISLVFNQNALAQDDMPNASIGVQYTMVKSGDEKVNGVGVTFNRYFGRFFGSDTSLDYFPNDGSKAIQMLSGTKIGFRNSKFGVFGKFRPGFIYSTTMVAGAEDNKSFSYAMDLGGVVEVYPTRRLGIRFDMGNLMTKTAFNTTDGIVNSKFTNNLQIMTGVMLRF